LPEPQKAKLSDLRKFHRFYARYSRNPDVEKGLKGDSEQFKERLLRGGNKPATVRRYWQLPYQ